MRFLIYGAGKTAQIAYNFLGHYRVECFATSDLHRKNDLCGKKVLAYYEMINLDMMNFIIVVASTKYKKEMEANLIRDGVRHYFVFNEDDIFCIGNFFPMYEILGNLEYRTYTHVLNSFKIERYKNIAIYGSNYVLPYLISEIEIQCNCHAVNYIIIDDYEVSTNDLSRIIGKKIVSINDVWDEIDCIVLNCRRDQSVVHEIIENKAHSFDVIDIYDYDNCVQEYNNPQLERYKDAYNGQRCFLIGNGPSLKTDDLMTLYKHGEVTFAFNMIFKIFDYIPWRPTFYGISDGIVYDNNIYELNKFECKAKFITDEYNRASDKKIEGVEYLHYNTREYVPCHPRFSSDITKEIFWGRTVIYDIGLQVAAYMGFKEIYLIGVDHNYSNNLLDKGNHFIDNYFDDNNKDSRYNSFSYEVEKVNLAYETAKKYASANDIRIYNATRGGKLEIFERVDFDNLFVRE